MQVAIIEQPEMFLVGLKTRTNNNNESSQEKGKIGPLVGRFYTDNIAEKIPNRKNPGISFSGYTNYESDEHGEYDYYFGELVSNLNKIPEGLSGLVIPAGKYLKFTTNAGKMPGVVIQAWQQIWQMTKQNQLGGQRTYQVDLEVYDHRAMDPNNTVLDILLAIK